MRENPAYGQTLSNLQKSIEDAEIAFIQGDFRGVYAHCVEVGNVLDQVVMNKLGKTNSIRLQHWKTAYTDHKKVKADVYWGNLIE